MDTAVPIFFVLGAFGAGKSTLAPLVAARLRECLVLDVDWLLPHLSALAGHDLRQDPASWPYIRQVWLAVAGASASAGRPAVILSPSEPAEIERTPSRELVGKAYWLLLDCADAELRSRLLARSGWAEEATQESIADASRYRTLGLETIRTDACAPDEAAEQVAGWVRRMLARTAEPARQY